MAPACERASAQGPPGAAALVCLSALHFLSGLSWSVQRPQGFLVVLFLGSGISEAGAGLIALSSLAAGSVGGPVVGLVADRLPVRRRYAVYSATAVARGAVYLLAWPALRGGAAFVGSLVAISLAQFCNAGAILTETTLRIAGAGGFGRVRLWGGIGFASGSLLTGMLAQLFPRLGLMVVFWENIVLTALTVLVTSWLARLEAAMAASSADLASALHEDACEAGRGSGHEAVPAAGQGGGEAQERVVDKVSKLLLSGPMPAFFLAVFSLGIGEGTMQMYTYVRLKELPYGTETVMGLSAVCMIVSEVPFFYYSAVLVRRFGVLPIVALALVCQCARQLWIALLWDARWVLPGELLHGITFSVANAAVCTYIRDVAPSELRNTAQAILNTVFTGLGQGGATLIGAAVIHATGTRALFLCSAVFAVASAALPAALALSDVRRRGRALALCSEAGTGAPER